MNSGIKGAVFFDYDGTLTDEIARIPMPTKGTLEAIALLRKRVSCHSRDGKGRVLRIRDGHRVRRDGHQQRHARRGERRGDPRQADPAGDPRPVCGVHGRAQHRIWHRSSRQLLCARQERSLYLDWAEHFSLPLEVYHETAPGEKIRGYKVSALYRDAAELEGMCANFGNVLEFTSVSGYNCLDVGEKGSNKADGVRAVISHFGIARENTYAFGDGLNDAEMFRAVGHPVAMGRHAPALDAIAEYVTGTVAEDGIANALRHYGLIGKE